MWFSFNREEMLVLSPRYNNRLNFSLELDLSSCGGSFYPYFQKKKHLQYSFIHSNVSFISTSFLLELSITHLPFSHNDIWQRCTIVKRRGENLMMLQLRLWQHSLRHPRATCPALTHRLTQPWLHPQNAQNAGGTNVSIYWWEMWISGGFFFSVRGQVSRQHHKSNNLSAPLCIDSC